MTKKHDNYTKIRQKLQTMQDKILYSESKPNLETNVYLTDTYKIFVIQFWGQPIPNCNHSMINNFFSKI